MARSVALHLPPLRTLAASTIDVVIIGGTVAGLSAAATVAKTGLRALLLEAAPALGRSLADAHLLPPIATLAECARSIGAVLAGEARVISIAEERGCAGSTHWRLTTEDGVTIPARGLIVACALSTLAAAADTDSAERKDQRLGTIAPGVAVAKGKRRNVEVAYRRGRSTALDIVRHLRTDAMPGASVAFL